MTAKLLVSGEWQEAIMAAGAVATPDATNDNDNNNKDWKVGQLVEVQPRTWAGINRPGGHGKVMCVHCNEATGVVESLDVKYTITGGFDKEIDPDLVKMHVELDRGRRSRRARELFTVSDKENDANKQKKKAAIKVTMKEKPVKSKSKATGVAKKSKKRKTAVATTTTTTTNNEAQVQFTATPQEIPRVIRIPSPTTPTASFTSPLSSTGGVETQQRTYMLPPRAKQQLTAFDSVSEYSTASDEFPAAKQEEEQEEPSSPISRVKYLGSGDFCNVPKSKSSLSSGKNKNNGDDCSNRDEQQPRGTRVKVTLREVYDQEWQKANDFIKDVVTDKEAELLQQQQQALPKVPLLPEVDERQTSFLVVFNDMLQNNDGAIDEDGLLVKINGQSTRRFGANVVSFTEAEMDSILSTLCKDNKIMKCDGQLYSI